MPNTRTAQAAPQNITSPDEAGKGISVGYDLEAREIVIRIPYDGTEEYEFSSSGSTQVIVGNSKVNALIDTGLNVPEAFFIPISVYRYLTIPRRLLAAMQTSVAKR